MEFGLNIVGFTIRKLAYERAVQLPPVQFQVSGVWLADSLRMWARDLRFHPFSSFTFSNYSTPSKNTHTLTYDL